MFSPNDIHADVSFMSRIYDNSKEWNKKFEDDIYLLFNFSSPVLGKEI